MNVLTDNTISVSFNDFTLRAKTWGNPKGKPIIALHGWLDNANSFDKIGPLLSEDHYVVAFDLAGHGLSDHRPANSSYYLWDYAIDIWNAIVQLGCKKVNIIAHSMGTGVATILAGAFPDRIEKLVFLDGLGAPFVVEEQHEMYHFKKAVRQLQMAKKAGLYGFSNPDIPHFNSKEEAIIDRTKPMFSSISYDAAALLVDRALRQVNGGYRWTYDPRIVLSQPYKMTEQQVQSFIENIQAETLIILGKQGLFAKGLFASRVEKFQHSQVHWLDGSHHLHLETAHQQIITLVQQFL